MEQFKVTESTNKVYLNPNFYNKSKSQYHPKASMYINPNFKGQIHTALNQINNPKIHVNPNFIKHSLPSTTIIDNNNVNTQPVNQTQNISDTPISKSRYCLIRKNKAVVKTDISTVVNNKIKVNRYKIVSVSANSHNPSMSNTTKIGFTSTFKFNTDKHQIKRQSVAATPVRNRFKFIQKNISPSTPILNKFNSTLVKYRKQIKYTPKARNTLGNLKKNNIPCPQFRKYGKCLRKVHGNCEFLHDKKHVSICRRFLKGVCHEANCLLSHELTDKKMPTCYFYLKGMCTKEGCPYLHIKLNEKAKICNDFLKGYCEKGEKCLNKHINICPDLSLKGVCIRKMCPYPHTKTMKRNGLANNKKVYISHKEIKKIYLRKTEINKVNITTNQPSNDQEKTVSDKRYYTVNQVKESNDGDIMLKPSRRKLGKLPSFIQL